MTARRWQVRLADPALADIQDALRYTRNRFGANQASIYRATIFAALAELRDGPDIIGSEARDDLSKGLRTRHVARRGRHGSHILLFRAEPPREIKILRILHERMDLGRHLPRET